MALNFKATKTQKSLLQGLAYWIADNEYMRERYGDNDPELKIVDDTIHALFDSLDRAGVPFWVQNSVIICAENWRRYHSIGIEADLKKRGITI